MCDNPQPQGHLVDCKVCDGKGKKGILDLKCTNCDGTGQKVIR